ncbi:hypothetical protein SU69_03110 [Thermosipho melanesiensis]|uniref:Uncharacterized protein n=2 Tax=Thermosipho melanesiensis TaxID=46541 RepID=A6LKM3_THEM4|nr:hypothetical protein [Thermosipho melanesiensis]ABR30474.1 hypothetical protein Tmel_0610 [Thermosipho melanesiensis BI429]APT74834.1 hypothetical protein BW47_03285 [Thermosipho melanesiensis]OOC35572.1 hypothetical protein SU68_03165 [Thermosipho melanesiensis]OOC39246.1 hypothetical protein SU69_03110 [Thermosipho melanesiensis]OOC39332.1 hypothetical protein SU70_03110 [Thermosipho melanesiensis]
MFKKLGIILLSVFVLSGLFAFGYRQINTTYPMYRNLPENSTISEISLSGIVKEIKAEIGEGVRLIIEVDGKEYTVHAGPIWLYKNLKTNDEIQLEGRLVSTENEEFIVATKIISNGTELVLRKDQKPVSSQTNKRNNNKGNNNRRNNKSMGRRNNRR